jgi:hypothetical protein
MRSLSAITRTSHESGPTRRRTNTFRHCAGVSASGSFASTRKSSYVLGEKAPLDLKGRRRRRKGRSRASIGPRARASLNRRVHLATRAPTYLPRSAAETPVPPVALPLPLSEPTPARPPRRPQRPGPHTYQGQRTIIACIHNSTIHIGFSPTTLLSPQP